MSDSFPPPSQPEQPYGGQQPPPQQPYGSYPPAPYAGQQPAGAVKPDNNLVWAILCTLLCCLPFGVVSIVYAAKVDGLWMSGQYTEAEAAAKSARTWAIAGAVSMVVLGLLYGLFVALALGAGFEGTTTVEPDYR